MLFNDLVLVDSPYPFSKRTFHSMWAREQMQRTSTLETVNNVSNLFVDSKRKAIQRP